MRLVLAGVAVLFVLACTDGDPASPNCPDKPRILPRPTPGLTAGSYFDLLYLTSCRTAPAVRWSSSNPENVVFDFTSATSARVRALKNGASLITVAIVGEGVRDTITITVLTPVVAGMITASGQASGKLRHTATPEP
jgi:hypothetical protein